MAQAPDRSANEIPYPDLGYNQCDKSGNPALASRAVAFGPAKTYHAHPNNLEAKKTKTLSLFIIKNYWYDPKGTTRVDYIPEV